MCVYLCVFVLLTSSIWSVQQPAGCASTHGWSDCRPANGGANGVDVCADCVIPIGIFKCCYIVINQHWLGITWQILSLGNRTEKFGFLFTNSEYFDRWRCWKEKYIFEHKCQHNLHTNLTLLRTHGLCRCWWSKTFAQRFGLQWQH